MIMDHMWFLVLCNTFSCYFFIIDTNLGRQNSFWYQTWSWWAFLRTDFEVTTGHGRSSHQMRSQRSLHKFEPSIVKTRRKSLIKAVTQKPLLKTRLVKATIGMWNLKKWFKFKVPFSYKEEPLVSYVNQYNLTTVLLLIQTN